MRCFRPLAALCGILTLALSLACAPACADLTFAPNVQRPELYQALYDPLPPSVHSAHVELRINAGIEKHGKAVWQEDGTISVVLASQKKPLTFLHEMGHVAHSLLPQWPEWEAFFSQNKRDIPRAKYGVYCGFAESFAYWQRGKRLKPEVLAQLENFYPETAKRTYLKE